MKNIIKEKRKNNTKGNQKKRKKETKRKEKGKRALFLLWGQEIIMITYRPKKSKMKAENFDKSD